MATGIGDNSGSRSADEVDVVRALFRAWRAGDVTAAEQLIAQEFVFTSPQDDRIDRATYLHRCFPTAARFVTHELRHVLLATHGEVLALYEYELADGSRYRNCEVLTVRDGRVAEVQVFFGGRVLSS